MFETLSKRLTDSLNKLRGRGVLTESDIDAAMREVRVALLEADVALPVVKQFTQSLKEKAVGEDVVRGINPAQMVIKLVRQRNARRNVETSDVVVGDHIEVLDQGAQ